VPDFLAPISFGLPLTLKASLSIIEGIRILLAASACRLIADAWIEMKGAAILACALPMAYRRQLWLEPRFLISFSGFLILLRENPVWSPRSYVPFSSQ